MYILGYGNNTVFQYSLSSAFDLSSASYDSVSFSVASQETQPQGIAFNSDGTKMYIVGFINDTVFQYSLSSSFDLSSASYDSVSFSVAGQDISPSGLCFNSDGSEMYVVGTTSDTIYQYSLSSSFDLSSASYNGASFNVSSEEAIPNDVYMRPDNLKFYVLGRGQDDLLQYSTGAGSVTTVLAGKALSSTSINLDYTT
jgi:sugar lactone lactonase YvrE